MYRLLVTDLDGTLLDDCSRIPDGNAQAIARASERGVKTVISSGRSYVSLKYFEERLGLYKAGNHGICFNGSTVYETHTRAKLMEHRLNRDVAMGILKALREFDVDVMVYVDELLYSEEKTDGVLAYRDTSRVPLTVIGNFEEIKEDVSKILLKGNYDELLKVARFMDPAQAASACECENFNETQYTYNVFFSSRTLLEFGCPGVDKSTGLLFLLKLLEIDLSECIAVGDQENDIPMIKAAGLGVAVRNAESAVQNSADYITRADNNECAIREIMERFIL